MNSRTAPALAATLALGLLPVACGRVEGRTEWQAALHDGDTSRARPAAESVFPVPAPPFSEGVFPCSRCHEGGTPAKDALPAIPHALHLGRGLECADCHAPDDPDAEPRIPARETCDPCHGDPAKLSERAAAYFAAVTDGGETKFPHRWTTRDVDVDHGRHARAGVPCSECHGTPTDAPFAKAKPLTLMASCVNCHEGRGRSVECAACHSKTTEKAHAKVVLHHAEQHTCLDCHDAADRDVLRLANGTRIPFEESFKLCGQCHGTQFRDWKVGLHGKRTGSWNGRREYRLCVHCHWPHEPKFAPMEPVARPARPDEVR